MHLKIVKEVNFMLHVGHFCFYQNSFFKYAWHLGSAAATCGPVLLWFGGHGDRGASLFRSPIGIKVLTHVRDAASLPELELATQE
jgi:hypothetical protein